LPNLQVALFFSFFKFILIALVLQEEAILTSFTACNFIKRVLLKAGTLARIEFTFEVFPRPIQTSCARMIQYVGVIML
jgi:hypothetical protein